MTTDIMRRAGEDSDVVTSCLLTRRTSHVFLETIDVPSDSRQRCLNALALTDLRPHQLPCDLQLIYCVLVLHPAGGSGLAVACLTAVREVVGSNRAVGSCVYNNNNNKETSIAP